MTDTNPSWIRKDYIIIGVLFAVLSVFSVVQTLGLREARDAARAAEIAANTSRDQGLFRDNFSNYMNCLIVNEDEVVEQVGEEAYIEICKQLLYLGIDPIPPTIKADPSLLTTTTTARKS